MERAAQTSTAIKKKSGVVYSVGTNVSGLLQALFIQTKAECIELPLLFWFFIFIFFHWIGYLYANSKNKNFECFCSFKKKYIYIQVRLKICFLISRVLIKRKKGGEGKE